MYGSLQDMTPAFDAYLENKWQVYAKTGKLKIEDLEKPAIPHHYEMY